MVSFPKQAHYLLRSKFHLKELRQLREVDTFSGDALEHVDCAIYNLQKQSVDMLLLMMMMIRGTMMLLMQPMMMMMTMMMVEMKRVLRVLVTMMKFRTFLDKESCNVFSSIKFVDFNNIRPQILNW